MKIILNQLLASLIIILSITSCTNKTAPDNATGDFVKPLYVTEPVEYDTDDPAIWINPSDPAQSLLIGTDKDENGGLYVYDLQGKKIGRASCRERVCQYV